VSWRDTPHPLVRAAIVGAYILVFYGALPAVLWLAGAGIDALTGLRWSPMPWAWALMIPAAALHATAVSTLWRRGGSAPITALPPPRFTRTGLYRWVRHPIYVSFNLLVPPAGLLLGSPGLTLGISIALLPCWMIYATVEERFLVKRFGDDYRAYQRDVGLLPGLGRRR